MREEFYEGKLKNIKDLAEATGGIGSRLKELEKKVVDLLKEKAPKPDR